MYSRCSKSMARNKFPPVLRQFLYGHGWGGGGRGLCIEVYYLCLHCTGIALALLLLLLFLCWRGVLGFVRMRNPITIKHLQIRYF
jgi:hypothetical protein